MHDFNIAIDIDAPVDIVWSVMRDGERWPEWTPTVTSIRLLDAPLRIGSRAFIRQPKLPPALWRITELDEGKSFTWVTRSPGVRVTARHSVEQLGDRKTRAILSIQFDGLFAGLVARLTKRLNLEYLDLEANGLKARCEGRRGVQS